MTPWPGAYTSIPLRNANVILKIHRARICEGVDGSAGTILGAGDDGILVATGKDRVILNEVQIAGGKRLQAGDFLRGHPVAPGTKLGKPR
jgi:methionyl-tRNA formyltransferase